MTWTTYITKIALRQTAGLLKRHLFSNNIDSSLMRASLRLMTLFMVDYD